MKNKKSFISYALAAVAGICFVQGLVILSYEGSVQNGTIGDVVTNIR